MPNELHEMKERALIDTRLEAARKLLAELKAAYDMLPARHRHAVRSVLCQHSGEPDLAA